MRTSLAVISRTRMHTVMTLAVTITTTLLVTGPRMTSAFVHRLDTCEAIAIPRCQAMPYNMTHMPNLLHHSTQENALLAFEQFHVLLDHRCSDVLLFFLCAMYAPICTVSFQPQPVPPCRSVCERARAGCEPLMNAHNVSWPPALDCSGLPRYERGVCVSPEAFVNRTEAGAKRKEKTKKKRCKCKKRKRQVRQLLRKHKYDYAFRAVVNRRKHVDATTMTVKVQVEEVLFGGKIKVPRSRHVTLWTNGSCGCPKLRVGRQYLLAGHEDVIKGRFLLSPASALALRWKDRLGLLVMRWRRQLLKKKRLSNSRGDNLVTSGVPSSRRKSQRRGRKRQRLGKSRRPPWRKRPSRPHSTNRKILLTNENLTH